MKTLTKNSFLLILPLMIFFMMFSIFFINQSSTPKALAETSPDAIAIRVIKNENFLSIDRWYQNQGFKGSPQKLKVDGYDAIRDGRTVYVGASNVTSVCFGGNNTCNIDLDCGPSGTCVSSKNFYTNIYLISYNQSPEQDTVDIFGQIISHWKFNANINNGGNCSQTGSILCLIDSECPENEYCTSQKANIVRDVNRLANLSEIKYLLEDYRQKKGYYPKLDSGTYLPGNTLSVWPSWQEALAKELGVTLPNDPINQIGSCPGYNDKTCWNDELKKFAGSISVQNIVTPVNSRLYGYASAKGFNYKICSNLETNYANTKTFKCDDAQPINNAPVIMGINLLGRPTKEFKGYVEAYDPDGDSMFFRVDLITPDANQWTAGYKWEWEPGLSSFSIKNTFINNQKLIYAPKAGKTSLLGMYKVKVTVKDSRGLEASREYEVIIGEAEMVIDSKEFPMIIGESKDFILTGNDSFMNDLTSLNFKNAFLSNNANISDLTALSANGLTLSGMKLSAVYASVQKTGLSTINVYAIDSKSKKRAEGYFKIATINNHPVIDKFTENRTVTKPLISVCEGDLNNCHFRRHITENATVKVTAHDPDLGHIITYSLLDDYNGKIAISQTGLITGLENLNLLLGSDSFNITVKVQDNYCSNSKPEECSSLASFKISTFNNPPVIDRFTENRTITKPLTTVCEGDVLLSSGCQFTRFVNENATVQVTAHDPDPRHAVKLSLLNDYNGKIAISQTGLITGLESLDNSLGSESFTIKVKAEDDYCNISKPEECSTSASFLFTLLNNPPVIDKFAAKYIDKSQSVCDTPYDGNCLFAIDNGEAATVQVTAHDPDPGQKVAYYLVDDFGGNLKIDGNTGLISGFEKLNFEKDAEETYSVMVRVEDGYCGMTKPINCSTSTDFKILIKKFCSVSRNMFVSHNAYSDVVDLENGVAINDFMSRIEFPIPDSCSEIGNSTFQVNVGGTSPNLNMDIVYIVDTSGSMNGVLNAYYCSNECNQGSGYKCCWDNVSKVCKQCASMGVNQTKPIDKVIAALNASINAISARTNLLPPSVKIQVGLVTFDDYVNNSETVNLYDIKNNAHKQKLISTITGLTASGGTNTLDALNKSETMMATSIADNKIIVLLSDGVPKIAKSSVGCNTSPCVTPPPPVLCTPGETKPCGCLDTGTQTCNTSGLWGSCQNQVCCTTGDTHFCGCGGTMTCVNQNWDPCFGSNCGGGGASFNEKADFKIAMVDVNSTHCASEYCTSAKNQACKNAYCSGASCKLSVDYDCDLSDSGYFSNPFNMDYVRVQADILKNLGYEIYTTFFDSGGGNNGKMCLWSSDINCPAGGKYSFQADMNNIDDIYSDIINRIFQKPDNIKINNTDPGWVLDDAKSEEFFDWTGINNILSCGSIMPLKATYENNGYLNLSNIRYDYCPKLLHK